MSHRGSQSFELVQRDGYGKTSMFEEESLEEMAERIAEKAQVDLDALANGDKEER